MLKEHAKSLEFVRLLFTQMQMQILCLFEVRMKQVPIMKTFLILRLVHIGPPEASKSYLDAEKILQASLIPSILMIRWQN